MAQGMTGPGCPTGLRRWGLDPERTAACLTCPRLGCLAEGCVRWRARVGKLCLAVAVLSLLQLLLVPLMCLVCVLLASCVLLVLPVPPVT